VSEGAGRGAIGPSDGPERTADGRWIVVRGRRWRASDPAIPEAFRQELVDALMAARRGVAAARRANDVAAEQVARADVQAAKVALGERGEPWWDEPTEAGQQERLTAAVRTLAGHRSPDRTICPSDAARAVGGDRWRSLMQPTREVARRLARAGQVQITQRGSVLDPEREWRGPIRIGSRLDSAGRRSATQG